LPSLLFNVDQAGAAAALRGHVALAAIIKSLKRKYHWPIETTSFPSNAADGRATWAIGLEGAARWLAAPGAISSYVPNS
jgi:hypothetical protein